MDDIVASLIGGDCGDENSPLAGRPVDGDAETIMVTQAQDERNHNEAQPKDCEDQFGQERYLRTFFGSAEMTGAQLTRKRD
jgi:hypothetical protein